MITSAMPLPCCGHFHVILQPQDFSWQVWLLVRPLQPWWHHALQLVAEHVRAVFIQAFSLIVPSGSSFQTKSSQSNLIHLISWFFSWPANISTSSQRCFNFVTQLWSNVDPTLKMKQNPMAEFQRCTTLILQCATYRRGKQSCFNVGQSCFNVVSTLIWPYLTDLLALPKRQLKL